MTSSAADDYDRAVRELVFEKRGQPSDRMKSEEEVAREERERLEKLEVSRLAVLGGFREYTWMINSGAVFWLLCCLSLRLSLSALGTTYHVSFTRLIDFAG